MSDWIDVASLDDIPASGLEVMAGEEAVLLIRDGGEGTYRIHVAGDADKLIVRTWNGMPVAPLATPAPRFYDDGTHHPKNGTLLGFWLYLMSDCLIFAVLFAVYAVLGRLERAGLPLKAADRGPGEAPGGGGEGRRAAAGRLRRLPGAGHAVHHVRRGADRYL